MAARRGDIANLAPVRSRESRLSTRACSEAAFAERLMHEMLAGGQYRKHVAHIRDKFAARRARMAQALERAGWTLQSMPEAGLFCGHATPASTTRYGAQDVD